VPAKAVELKVDGVAVDWRGSPVVVLREKGGRRAVFIWVGIAEATAIGMYLENRRPPRPWTHDLIVLILGELGSRVERITISDMRSDTYYAELQLRTGNQVHKIDCRPSDAIAVALRTSASIYIDNDLLTRLDAQQRDAEAQISSASTFVDADENIVH